MPLRYYPKGLHTANVPFVPRPVTHRPATASQPFVTIAQQVGAEIPVLPARLAELATQRLPGPPWAHWDQELIEHVSKTSHISPEVIASIETSSHSWFDDLLAGISGQVDEFAVLHRIEESVREIAATGHAVLVGHGSIYMTRDLPAGLHVRLIAPLEFRIARLATRLNCSNAQAAHRLRRMDRARNKFFRRYWPGRPPVPEMFTAEFNVARLSEDQIAHMILAALAQIPAKPA